ncbi:SAM-dependent methyltransferase [Streptomyces sp. NPDC053048]|uniref:SAM-dependent methyltransferase n=1 Tax=Streptomyces sp. NPDC053048 TaxID=3365694 RepID=UPI0037CE0A84
MEHRRARPPVRIDATVPSVARMYDYYLGGKDNYPADREACERLLGRAPGTALIARNNRRFLRRVVRRLSAEYGIRQFLDHGSGLPARENVHEVAQRVHEDARVVYIDHDPVVLAHGRALLEEDERTAVVRADLRDTAGILGHPRVTGLIDFAEPVAALFVSVLHCVPDEDAPELLVRDLARRLAPGSCLVVCQLVSDDAETRRSVTDFMLEVTGGAWGRVRERREVAACFEGLEVLEPGLVEVSAWRPGPEVAPGRPGGDLLEFGGVGRVG